MITRVRIDVHCYDGKLDPTFFFHSNEIDWVYQEVLAKCDTYPGMLRRATYHSMGNDEVEA